MDMFDVVYGMWFGIIELLVYFFFIISGWILNFNDKRIILALIFTNYGMFLVDWFIISNCDIFTIFKIHFFIIIKSMELNFFLFERINHILFHFNLTSDEVHIIVSIHNCVTKKLQKPQKHFFSFKNI